MILNKIHNLIKILFTSKPRVFWWSMVNVHNYDQENFGDILTPYIVSKLSGTTPFYINMSSRLHSMFKHSLMVGSIISYSKPKSLVWGSGIIKKNDDIKGGVFLAVRGPRTAKRLIELGFRPPQVLGDPALLLSKLYKGSSKKIYDIGIITHYVDYDDIKILVSSHPDILLIDLRTDSVEKTIDEILKCKRVISTSLHGIIVAHSYGLPTIWWKFSDKLSGDDIKFVDYFESVEMHNVFNYEKTKFDEVLKNGQFVLPNKAAIDRIQKNLLKTYPYKIKRCV